jgi:hypothetical protein
MPTRPVLRARAAAAGRLLGAGSPLSVRPWFSAGYVLANRTGKSTHVSELDSLWSTARAWGAALPAFPDLRETVSFALPAHLDAVTVWLGAVAHLVRPSDLELRVPDPARDRTVVAQVGPARSACRQRRSNTRLSCVDRVPPGQPATCVSSSTYTPHRRSSRDP